MPERQKVILGDAVDADLIELLGDRVTYHLERLQEQFDKGYNQEDMTPHYHIFFGGHKNPMLLSVTDATEQAVMELGLMAKLLCNKLPAEVCLFTGFTSIVSDDDMTEEQQAALDSGKMTLDQFENATPAVTVSALDLTQPDRLLITHSEFTQDERGYIKLKQPIKFDVGQCPSCEMFFVHDLADVPDDILQKAMKKANEMAFTVTQMQAQKKHQYQEASQAQH